MSRIAGTRDLSSLGFVVSVPAEAYTQDLLAEVMVPLFVLDKKSPLRSAMVRVLIIMEWRRLRVSAMSVCLHLHRIK